MKMPSINFIAASLVVLGIILIILRIINDETDAHVMVATLLITFGAILSFVRYVVLRDRENLNERK